TGFDGVAMAAAIKAARELHVAGKDVEALAKLDSLPAAVRATKAIAVMRVEIASAISRDAKRAALDEVATMFPNDPTIAMLEIDGALLRGDYDGALRNVDTVDRAIGGDPFQDAVRAEILLKRNHPGDLDRAHDLVESVIRADPALKKAWT